MMIMSNGSFLIKNTNIGVRGRDNKESRNETVRAQGWVGVWKVLRYYEIDNGFGSRCLITWLTMIYGNWIMNIVVLA